MRRYTTIIFLMFVGLANAQVGSVTETQVRAELQKRGIAEGELLREMNARGIAITDLENLTPSQLAELEIIVAELESRKANSTLNRSDSLASNAELDKEAFLDAPSIKEVEQVKEQVKEVSKGKKVGQDTVVGVYGHAFFKDRSLSLLETSTEVKAPGNYILGAGDKIVISIFGISREELAHEIDSDGYIEVANRKIFLKGLTLDDAKKKLFDNLSRFYRFTQGQFDVALSYSRTVNVNIQGEVSRPGGYTISAINNVFNGLLAAGGPTEIGSLRDILLVKNDGQIISLDFYSFLRNPGETTNASLEEGDVIVVPVARKIVSIQGGVKRPMKYEMKMDEDLGDIIEMAGGYTSDANRSLIQILRYGINGTSYLDVQGGDVENFELIDGDRIKINRVDNDLNNFVEIKGAVVNDGEYQRTKEMTVRGLLDLATLKPEARRDLSFIRRFQEDGKIIYIPISLEEGSVDMNLELTNRDLLNIYNLNILNENLDFQVSGAVKNPGSFELGVGEQITIKDAIQLAGGLRRDASDIGIIHTIDTLNPKIKKYERIDLSSAYDNPGSFVLTALDSLEIFSQSLFDERSNVSIVGAVNNPGDFQYGEGMTIADALTMAGGFQFGAASKSVEIYRLLIVDNEPTKTVIANLDIDIDMPEGSRNLDFALMPYDEVVVRFVPEFELQQIVTITGEVRFPGQYSLLKDNETIRDLLLRAGGITEEAFPSAARLVRTEDDLGVVVIKLGKVLKDPSSRFNFRLRDGDELIIPKSKDFVSILGATNASKLFNQEIIGSQEKINVPYHEGKNAKFYIEQYAGGIAEDGSLNEIYVEDANGEIARTRNYFIYRSYPTVEIGSKIVVGRKSPKTQEEKDREDIDWSKVLADSVGQAVSILSLLLIIERL